MARQTQAEIREEKTQNFLSDSRTKFDELVVRFFLGQGYFLLPEDLEREDLPSSVLQIQKPVVQFLHAGRLVSDGASLTDKRKVEMLEALYGLENIVDRTSTTHPILALYLKLQSKRFRRAIFTFLAILSAIIGFGLPPSFIFTAIFGFFAYRNSMVAKSLQADIEREATHVISKI